MAARDRSRVTRRFQNGQLIAELVNGEWKEFPRIEWPLWAKSLKLFAAPQDKGIGDVVARKIGAENSQAFKIWYKRIFGKDCCCTGRQADWNARYPL